MNDRPLVSVIVPVYNTEEYLEKCVDSLRNQTLKEIEIILIDDESPDRCPEMCDEFAGQDERIRVLHMKNAGLSGSRNSGIDAAAADRICFVDSDDYVADNLCEELLALMEETGADVAVGGLFDVYKTSITPQVSEVEIQVFTGEEAFGEILKGSVLSGSSCSKIYEKRLFDEKRFPLGLTYEDSYIIPEIMLEAGKVAVTNKKYYYYWHRSGTFTTERFNKRTMDVITSYQHTLDVAKAECPEKIPEAQFRVWWAHFVVLDRMLWEKEPEKLPHYAEVTGYLKQNWKEISRCAWFQKSRRIAAVALKIGIPFYKVFWKLHELRTAKN